MPPSAPSTVLDVGPDNVQADVTTAGGAPPDLVDIKMGLLTSDLFSLFMCVLQKETRGSELTVTV